MRGAQVAPALRALYGSKVRAGFAATRSWAGTRDRSSLPSARPPVHGHAQARRPRASITSGKAAARARQQRGITTAGTGSHEMTPIGTATSEGDACRSAFALVIHVHTEEVTGSIPVSPTQVRGPVRDLRTGPSSPVQQRSTATPGRGTPVLHPLPRRARVVQPVAVDARYRKADGSALGLALRAGRGQSDCAKARCGLPRCRPVSRLFHRRPLVRLVLEDACKSRLPVCLITGGLVGGHSGFTASPRHRITASPRHRPT